MTKIVFFGTPKFSAIILNKLIENNYKPSLVITAPDKPVGRESKSAPSPVKIVAKKNNIPVKTYGSLRGRDDVEEEIKKYQPDLIIVAAYGKIIPQNILDIPKIYPINVHGSILPKLRGASPVQYAILEGLSETGITLMVMNDKMDEGDILKIKKIPIEPSDTSTDLFQKMADVSASFLIESLPEILNNKIKPQPQNHTQSTYTKLLSKQDGQFDFENPPSNLGNMIRAYFPWPGVFTEIDNQTIKFLPNNMIQLPNRKAITVKDFKNTYKDLSGKLTKTLELL